jgi:uncharacterized protein
VSSFGKTIIIYLKLFVIVASMERVIAVDKVCKSFLSKSLGLMFSGKKTLLFVFSKPQQIALHNWFVFFPLTLVFLDEEKRVVEVKRRFMPFSLYSSKVAAQYVIEIPGEFDVGVEDKITIKRK